MKIKEIVNELNERLSVLEDKVYNPDNDFEFGYHNDTIKIIRAYFEEKNLSVFNVTTWSIFNKQYGDQILRYELLFEKDKRCKYKQKGILRTVYVTTCLLEFDELDISELNRLLEDKKKNLIRKNLMESIEIKKAELLELEDRLSKLD